MKTVQPVAKPAATLAPASHKLILQPRDAAILCDAYAHGMLSRDAVWELHFRKESGDLAALRIVKRRLKLLSDAGYLHAAPMPVGPIVQGFPLTQGIGQVQYLYRPTSAAASLISKQLGLEESEVRRHLRTPTPGFVAHTLAVLKARLSLEAASREYSLPIEVRGEHLLTHAYEWRSPQSKSWRRDIFRPDALAQLKGIFYFIEIDLSSCASQEIRNKLETAKRYRETSSLFAARYQAPGFTTLVLTTTPGRAAMLIKLAHEVGANFVWVATLPAFHEAPLAGIFTTGTGEIRSLTTSS